MAMTATETSVRVPPEIWGMFLDGFSRTHSGWLSTLSIVGASVGAQVEARNIPLEGITARHRAGEPILISLGYSPDRRIEHQVDRPSEVWVELSPTGAEAALEIVSADGTRTILQFRAAPRPEAVDGIAPEEHAEPSRSR
jgi:Family of unknown function (DUF5335)